jgi:hypothetical protein
MAIAGALGLAVQFVPDPDATVSRRWQRRRAMTVRDNHLVARAAIRRAAPIVLAERARKGGLARWAGASAEAKAEAIAVMNRARLARRASSTKAA